MGVVDWFDFAFHGAPWVWLIATLVGLAWRRRPGAKAA
jgi:hypothetical protein